MLIASGINDGGIMGEYIRGDRMAKGPAVAGAGWIDDLDRTRRSGPAIGSEHRRSAGEIGQGLSTVAVHAGSQIDERTGAVGTPIYQATTFRLGEDQYRAFAQGYARDRFIYTRYGNPSQWAVQQKIAALEGAESALVFSSGMAAIATTLLALVDKGGHVVASNELYGGTYALLNGELPNLGMSASFVDPRDLAAIEAAITPATQVLFFEALTNPLLKVVDIDGVVAVARRHGLRVVIDATFATPVSLRPIDHGVDVVVHSATKYLNGHSDLIAGTAAGERKLIDQIWGRMLAFGGCLDPHGCFMLERGLKTLALRMRAQAETALVLARYLETSPHIRRVYYPFLESHEDYELAATQLRYGSGVVSFEVKGGDRGALRLLQLLELPVEATSLGGIESLVSLPFNSSHSGFTTRQRAGMGINPGLVRFSVGIEDASDLIADLDRALDRLQGEGFE